MDGKMGGRKKLVGGDAFNRTQKRHALLIPICHLPLRTQYAILKRAHSQWVAQRRTWLQVENDDKDERRRVRNEAMGGERESQGETARKGK